MQVAARPFLAAGVALVGASAIAVSPMAPSMPQVHMPVALTAAIDNPLVVFEPVATATQTLISNIIERQTTNPAPILRQLIANAVAGGQVFAADPINVSLQAIADAQAAIDRIGPNLTALGETTTATGTAFNDAFNALGQALPIALEAAQAQIDAGDINGGIDTVMQSTLQPLINILLATTSEINAVGAVLNIPQPLLDATGNALIGVGVAIATSTLGIGVHLPDPQPLVQQFITGVQQVSAAAASGDPINVLNAMQHSTADFVATTIAQVDQTIGMANSLADVYVSALKELTPKPVTPTPSLSAAAPAAITATAAAAPAIDSMVKPAAKTISVPVSNADNGSDTEADGTEAGTAAGDTGTEATDTLKSEAPESTTTDAAANAATDSETAAGPVTGTSATESSSAPAKASPKVHVKRTNPLKAAGEHVKSAVKKATSGPKKAAGAGKKTRSSKHSGKGSHSK
ncbi:hypothetical protein FR943_20895 [Mycobacterium sp. TNTM28]|uniref:PE-PGRS family protein n=1 Tax=[Mycobacterium] fortunisiensis TaxID=2600579 RepID=A0ABS6KRV0_9MYCO|nr:hypothetical protein [[Mycobacterium] fortunisiensis]MBU9766291.1 hypothetical protein [[Mycobacterium] fortunisiensis]